MKLQLKRPIVFIDIEGTGIDCDVDRIVELSLVKLHPNGEREIKTRRINPIIPIPESATAIHGITNDDIANEPTFKLLAKSLIDFISECDFAGFNSLRYDFPLLYNEFRRAGIEWNYKASYLVDVGNIFKIKEQRTLTAAYKFYCNKDLEGAHGAEADTVATAEVLASQLDRYEDLPSDVSELALISNYDSPILDISGKFTSNDAGDILINFGKYRGQPASEHLDFIHWMYFKADFNPDTNNICEMLLQGY
ncbi:3'-5' exonuclease [Taibaiella lutea]|uniref:3'-5' exonuclease n=1 Tax=Taibaiella lutea TaxID=2608001 RepID=A0A5M6CHX0_9BACT|nr:3'-5' exonuclease [Taibaiella lutea]KAA5532689.1 3'-5' exonuclease [Taibaiella lutea]